MVNNFNKKLGKAFEIHRKQDLSTHDFKYDFSDRIPKDSILLMSGGLDSFCIWRLLGQPKAIYFDIENRSGKRELESIIKIREKFKGDIIIESGLKLGKFEFDNGYIPYRNLFFIMYASIYSENVVMGQIAEYAPDKNFEFYRRTEKLLRQIGKGSFQGIDMKPKIYAPFARYTKSQLIKTYVDKFGDDYLIETTSCYSGCRIPCGKCSACMTRYMAMTISGIHENYQHTPDYADFKKRFSIKDFKVNQIGMYLRRWRELREFRRKLREIR